MTVRNVPEMTVPETLAVRNIPEMTVPRTLGTQDEGRTVMYWWPVMQPVLLKSDGDRITF
jgi:hypothetical protein